VGPDVQLLLQIRLRDREDALPVGATRHLLTMLALSKLGAAYVGVEIVKELSDRESLAAFGWALFRLWQENGRPPRTAGR
jgi:hypothetical protein